MIIRTKYGKKYTDNYEKIATFLINTYSKLLCGLFFCPHQLKKINVFQTFKGNRCRQTEHFDPPIHCSPWNLMITRFPPNKNTIVFLEMSAKPTKHKDEVWRRFVKVAWTVRRSAARYRLELCERSHLQKRVRAAVRRLHTLSPNAAKPFDSPARVQSILCEALMVKHMHILPLQSSLLW